MGYIEEPNNVDLVIEGGELTAGDRKLLSALVKKERAAKSRPTAKRAMAKAGTLKRTTRKKTAKTK